MKRVGSISGLLMGAVLLSAFGDAQTKGGTALVLTGHSGQAPVVKMNGRSYVDVEDLTRLTQGSLAFRANQIVLTLPGAHAQERAATSKAKTGFSKEFLQAGIEEMGIIREWRIAIVNAIQNNYPVSEAWISARHRLADKDLALVAAAVSTDDDRSALPLISAEFNNMQEFSNNYLATRRQQTYISPSAVDNDPLDQQILTCARGLADMAANNKFQDEPACH